MGAGPVNPQLLAQLMQLNQNNNPAAIQPPQPAAVQQALPQFQNNPRGALLPTGSTVPTPRGIQPNAGVPPMGRQGGMSGQGMFPAIIGGVIQAKRAFANQKMEKARQLANSWIALAGGGDPQLKQQADAMMNDPKVHKIFDKAMKDPTSPEAQGIQMAYQDQQQKDLQKMAIQEQRTKAQQVYALMMAEMSRARQSEAAGNLSQTRADMYGQVTDAERYKQQQQNQRTMATIQARMQMARNALEGMDRRARMRIGALERIAALHEKGATGRATMRTQQNQALNAKIKQYKNLQSEVANLIHQQKDLDADILNHPVAEWVSGQSDEYQAKAAAIADRQQTLQQQMDDLNSEINDMTTGGVIPSMGVGGGKAPDDTAAPTQYVPGMVRKGYEFLGGDPTNQQNWIPQQTGKK
jgi:hypothetical protein